MKTLLAVALVVSLVGNCIVGYIAFQRSSAATERAASAASSADALPESEATQKGSEPGSSPELDSFTPDARLWSQMYAAEDLPTLVARLRAAGFPPKVVRAVAQQLVSERLAAASGEEKRPFWVADFSAKAREARLAANRERQHLLETILGADGTPSALLDDATRDRRYGDLSADKINALVKLERDYDEVMNMVVGDRMGRPMTAEEGRRHAQERELVEREKRADLAKILTPAEIEQYEMRTSPTANRLINQLLRNTEVSEQEYTALYRMQKAFDEKFPQSMTTQPDGFRARQAAQLEHNEQVRTVLSDARFYDYLSNDFQYNQTREFTKAYPAVTPANTYELYRLQLQVQLATQAVGQNQSLTSTQRFEQMRAIAAEYAPKVTAVIGADAFDAYKKTPQGRFYAPPVVTPGPGRP